MVTHEAAHHRVAWAELFPDELEARRRACPVVYLPMGLCEPHGRGAALGLDLIKAEHYCREAAARLGGVVAPSQGYHIHETGYHARWLEDVVGEVNAALTSVPPSPLLYMFLYQLRAFANAGFAVACVLTGHAGGNEHDLRLAARLFSERSSLAVRVTTDAELVAGRFEGDHAGKFEISQLVAMRPDLVDPSRLARDPYELGRFALGDNHEQASVELGRQINLAIVAALEKLVLEALPSCALSTRKPMNCETVEAVWDELRRRHDEWQTLRPRIGQAEVSATSRWKSGERLG